MMDTNSGTHTRYQLALASTDADLDAVCRFRYEHYSATSSYLLQASARGDHVRDRHDGVSYVFVATIDGKVAATCRATPFVNGEWEISRELHRPLTLPFPEAQTLQINRVLVDPNHRGARLHERLFHAVCAWSRQDGRYSYYFAVSQASQMRLYAAIGAKMLLAEPLLLSRRNQKPYFVLGGTAREAEALLSRRLNPGPLTPERSSSSSDIPCPENILSQGASDANS